MSDSILFQLRDNNPFINEPNMWVLPGGNLESFELQIEGLIREIVEETNYILRNPKFLLNVHLSSNINRRNLYFYFENYDGIQNIKCLEGQKMLFLNRNQIMNLIQPKYLKVVLNHFSQKFNLFK